MGKIDVKKLKAKLAQQDYEKILEALEIPIYLRGPNYIIYYSGDKYKDFLSHKPKLYFYTDNKIFMNFSSSCSYDIIGLVQKRLTILNEPSSFMDAVKFIMSAVGLETDEVSRINNSKHQYNWQQDLEKFVRFRRTGSMLPTYDKSILDQLEPCYPQSWIDEGISVETMEKYHIGYYERGDATTIPCFNREGELCGIRVRNWNPEQLTTGRKYIPLSLLDNTQYKFPTNDVFFGINYNAPAIEYTKTAILVESEKAVMQLDTWMGENNIALGMFGKNLGTKRRNELIKLGVAKIIYVPDNDYIGKSEEDFDKWQDEVMRFAKQFHGYCDVEIVWDNLNLLGPKENATDRDFETWQKLYENREIIA